MYSPKEHSRMVDLSNLLLFWDTWHILKCSRWASSLFRPGERRGSSAGEEQAHQMKKGCRNGEAKERKDILCVRYTSYAQTSYKEDGTPKSPPPPLSLSPCDAGTVQKQKKKSVKENEAGTRVTSLLHANFKTKASKERILGLAL